MLRILFLLIMLSVPLIVPASAKVEIPEPVTVEALPPETETRPVKLSKIVVDLRRGEPFGKIKGGLICMGAEPLVWRGGRSAIDPTEFNNVFSDELSGLGFDVIGQSDNLFDDGRDNRAEFLMGGSIKSIFVDACLPKSGFGDVYSVKGSAIMELEW